MNFRIVPYEDIYKEQVKIFNRTIENYNKHINFRPDIVSPPTEEAPIYTESYLAFANDIVCGGYCLKFQPFQMQGQIQNIGMYQIPISLGIGDKKYADVGVRILLNALRRKTELFCLGMGGLSLPLPRLLTAMRWRVESVPFSFYVAQPFHFLRGLVYLRKNKLWRLAMDIAAFTGLGTVAIKCMQKRRNHHKSKYLIAEVEPFFAAWADILWQEIHSEYAFIGLRNSKTLNQLYPKDDPRFLRLRVSENNRIVGWVVVLATQMKNHKQFGDLFVGSIADCLAAPRDAEIIIQAATKYLIERGVDVIVTNQTHCAWNSALKQQGYLSGTSNFIFAASPGLNQSLKNISLNKMHLNRGDNDGPINL